MLILMKFLHLIFWVALSCTPRNTFRESSRDSPSDNTAWDGFVQTPAPSAQQSLLAACFVRGSRLHVHGRTGAEP